MYVQFEPAHHPHGQHAAHCARTGAAGHLGLVPWWAEAAPEIFENRVLISDLLEISSHPRRSHERVDRRHLSPPR